LFEVNSFNFNDLALLFIIFSIVFLFEFLIKQYYIIKKEKDHQKIELLKIKRDPEIFISKLKYGNKVDLPDIEPTIIVGNRCSDLTITIFLSFYCSACARLFPEIHEFIKSVQKVSINLVFYPTQDELVRKMFKLIKSTETQTISSDVLYRIGKWYSTDISERNKILDIMFDYQDQDKLDNIMQRSKALFDSGNITHVPKIFINGYALPTFFKLDDVKFQIDNLRKLKYGMNLIEI
jgi:hypothetical protein